ncbi:restriction endonuclease [bacterium]|nr:restriction endonuclease [bacterium]
MGWRLNAAYRYGHIPPARVMRYHGDLSLFPPRQRRAQPIILTPATHEVEFPSTAAPIHHVDFTAPGAPVVQPDFTSMTPPIHRVDFTAPGAPVVQPDFTSTTRPVHEPPFPSTPAATHESDTDFRPPAVADHDTAEPPPALSSNLLPTTEITTDLAAPAPTPTTWDLAELGMDDWREILGLNVPPEFLDAGNVRIWEQNLDADSIVRRLERMDSGAFEHVVAEVLRRSGYTDVWVTGGVRDEAVRIVATRTLGAERRHTAVFCVPAETVTAEHLEPLLETLMASPRYQTGLLVTWGSLDDACREEIDNDDTLLALDGHPLAERIQANHITLPND